MIHVNLESVPDHILEALIEAIDRDIKALQDDRNLVVVEQLRRQHGNQMQLDV